MSDTTPETPQPTYTPVAGAGPTTAAPAELSTLERKLDDAVSTAKKRRTTLTVVFIVLALVLCGYLGYAWYKISEVDPELVVGVVEAKAQPYLNRPADQWAADLKQQAPNLIDQAGQALLDVPAAMSEQVTGYVQSTVDQQMPEIEKQLREVMTGLLDEMQAAINTDFSDGQISDAEAKQELTMIAEQFDESLNAQLDQVFARYGSITGDMIDHLDKLASKQDLSESESLHREILVNFLALLKKTQQEQAGG